MPASGNPTFGLRFIVEVDRGGEGTQERKNAALVSTEVNDEILVSLNNTEIMGMSKKLICKLICKKTKTQVPQSAINITKETVTEKFGDPEVGGVRYQYSVNRNAVANCGALMFDPHVTPLGEQRWM
jgi:hypothetical protein